jgi:hypothetical protein
MTELNGAKPEDRIMAIIKIVSKLKNKMASGFHKQ